MSATRLQAGDEVIHPRYGFGVVDALQARERDGVLVEYYDVRLSAGGVLSVPADQAGALGLRRVVNGVAATVALLEGEAVPLPEHPRTRYAELTTRWESPEPEALASAVRDLLGWARQFGLNSGEQQWLTRACERLGAEAARVDGISAASARSAITRAVSRLKTPPPPPEPAKGQSSRKRARGARA